MGAKRNCFPQKEKYFLEGGEVVAAASDEAQLLDMEADDFASWADALDGKKLARALAKERAAGWRNELEQDEQPIDYTAELEDARRRKPRPPAAAEAGTAGRGAAPAGGRRPDRGGL